MVNIQELDGSIGQESPQERENYDSGISVNGTRKLMKKNGVDVTGLSAAVEKLEEEGKTAMLMAIDGKLAAIIGVADTIKELSEEAITQL